MDVKLKTAELLLRKLEFGCSNAKRQAVSEIRLFSKWDEDNRICLVRAGAVPLLIDLLASIDTKVQENSVTALLNLSIHSENRNAIANASGGLDAIAEVLRQGRSNDSKANAAALLSSLVVEESLRPVVGSHPNVLSALLELLRDGSSKCKADSLRALYLLSLSDPNRPKLVSVGAIPLLIALVMYGKVRLTEDSLAVLAQIAGCPDGSASLLNSDIGISIIIDLLDAGSPLAQENAATALFNMCKNGGDKAVEGVLDYNKCIPAIRKLYFSSSSRGKSKAEALMKILKVSVPCTSDVLQCVREISTMEESALHSQPAPKHRSRRSLGSWRTAKWSRVWIPFQKCK